jgi:hypothetical protein
MPPMVTWMSPVVLYLKFDSREPLADGNHRATVQFFREPVSLKYK